MWNWCLVVRGYLGRRRALHAREAAQAEAMKLAEMSRNVEKYNIITLQNLEEFIKQDNTLSKGTFC